MSITLSLAGVYSFILQLNGLNIQLSPYSITVSPDATTSAAASSTTQMALSYNAGQTMKFLIEARDAYGNLSVTSSSDLFLVALTGEQTVTYLSPVLTSNMNGTYSVAQQLTVADTYTLSITFGGVFLAEMPVSGIKVIPDVP